MTVTSEINPMPIVDDWAVLSDGSIAIVRGQDYHVDFLNADGTIAIGDQDPVRLAALDATKTRSP